MSSFLENLKNAADNGEFNSEAAKKIIEINELADSKIVGGNLEDYDRIRKNIDERYSGNTETVGDDVMIKAQTNYQKRMEEIRLEDNINIQIAGLARIETEIDYHISELSGLIDNIESNFDEEFEKENPKFGDLYLKIEQLKTKFKTFIN